jgi:hypothetical protein
MLLSLKSQLDPGLALVGTHSAELNESETWASLAKD